MEIEQVRALSPEIRKQASEILEANSLTWDWVKDLRIDWHEGQPAYVSAVFPLDSYEHERQARASRSSSRHWCEEWVGNGVERCPADPAACPR